jgi:hypothetical protein
VPEAVMGEVYKRYIASKIKSGIESGNPMNFIWGVPEISFIESINSENPLNINQELFKAYLERVYCTYRYERDNIKERYAQLANELGLADYFDKWLNPKLSQWDIERDQSYEKLRAEIKERICKNEKALKLELAKDPISVAALHFIAQFYYDEGSPLLDNHMGKDTQQVLSEHLKHAVFNLSQSSHSTLLTLDSLVENSIGANRKIDIVYYVSVCKNSWDSSQWEKLETQCSPEFIEYLYINYVQNSYVQNSRPWGVIRSETFLKSVPHEFSQSTLIKFFKLATNRYCNYIPASLVYAVPIEKLKKLIRNHEILERVGRYYGQKYTWDYKNIFLNNILHDLNFDIPEDLLNSILFDSEVSKLNQEIAQALKNFINFKINDDDMRFLESFSEKY